MGHALCWAGAVFQDRWRTRGEGREHGSSQTFLLPRDKLNANFPTFRDSQIRWDYTKLNGELTLMSNWVKPRHCSHTMLTLAHTRTHTTLALAHTMHTHHTHTCTHHAYTCTLTHNLNVSPGPSCRSWESAKVPVINLAEKRALDWNSESGLTLQLSTPHSRQLL